MRLTIDGKEIPPEDRVNMIATYTLDPDPTMRITDLSTMETTTYEWLGLPGLTALFTREGL